MKVIGLDPGLNTTGWGVIEQKGSTLSALGYGCIKPPSRLPIEERLHHLFLQLSEILRQYLPEAAAVEKTFVNRNPASALSLGFARGVVLMTPACFGVSVHEYTSTLVKKAIIGHGHAEKPQIMAMMKSLLSLDAVPQSDSADALAIAICHLNTGA